MKTLIIALLVCEGLCVSAQEAVTSHRGRKQFSHEASAGYGIMNVPAGGWGDVTRRACMPSYQLGYRDEYFLKLRYFSTGREGERESWWEYHSDNRARRERAWKQPDYISMRKYRVIDVVVSRQFLKAGSRHKVYGGVGFSHRDAEEYYFPDGYPPGIEGWSGCIIEGELVARRDYGVVTEVAYSYNLTRHLVTGAELAFRTYRGSQPLMTFGLKLGLLLRH